MANETQSRTARRKQQAAKKKPKLKRILLIIGLAFLAIGLSVGGLFTYYVVTAPDLDPEKLSDPFSSKVYDEDGELFADLGDIKRTKIEYDDLPDVLIDAVTATEDVRFFKHSGIDARRILGAIKANITRGFGSEGASTITQQVVENSFLESDKKLKRKVQEQWLSLKLERQYSKEQIMEMYLNKIYYGSNAYGVAKAAEVYFGKSDLHDLTLIESAILAGLPQRPSAYDPYVDPELTAWRVNTVLNLMVRHEKITEEEADEARQIDIESLLAGKADSKETPYQAFIQKVDREVKDKLDGADIFNDGLKIYTTIDQDIQSHVEFLLTDSDDNPIPYPDDELQTGLVVLDTKTGAIRAVGGGRNSDGNMNYNHAYQGGKQPGSTFKPIVSYGPAIEHDKISTYHQLDDDKPFEISGTDSVIRNVDRVNRGWVTAREALSQSINVPTVKLLEETGYQPAQKFAEGLGVEFQDDQLTIGDAIGGTGTNSTPVQVAGAFSAFGNEGIYNEPYAVTKVEFPDGKVVDLTPESHAAMSDYTAYMVTDMLKTAISEGTGTTANISGLPVAGKTGTTNLKDVEGALSTWFSGYTTNYTISIWAGGYKDEENKRTTMPNEARPIPQHLFKNIMTEISEDIDTADFKKPDSVVEVKVERGSNPASLPSNYTPSENIITELFVKGTEPSSVSEKYDKLDPVSDLQAQYDEDDNEIEVEWDYDNDDDVSFEVSMRVDGGEMKKLSTTEDTSLDISDIEAGSSYDIQVVVIGKDNNMKSEPKTVTVNIEDKDEDIPSVNNLTLEYNEDKQVIDVSWEYDGPDAEFEVNVSPENQTQTVQSEGIEISGVQPGKQYTITVIPIGKKDGSKGDSQTADINIPENEVDEENNNQNNENSDNNEDNNHSNENDNNNNNDNSSNNNNNSEDNENDEPVNNTETDNNNNQDEGNQETNTEEP